MKMFDIQEFLESKDQDTSDLSRRQILGPAEGASQLKGMLVCLRPGSGIPYHYHEKRESVILFLSGEAIEVVEGEQFTIGAGTLIFIPPGEKHATLNRSEKDVKYLEFWTGTSEEDFIRVG
ncbi:MAG: cupin domain-containing protein [Deltaproteobacteria bacterium]|nr:cupin domain-containing protein [Deltaproteobacteria bacterium]